MTYDELRKLAEQATPGPWYASGEFVELDHRMMITGADGEPYCDGECGIVADAETTGDARYIAAASPDVVIGLLDEITEAQDLAVSRGDQIVRMREEIAQLRVELDATARESTVQRDRAKRAEKALDARPEISAEDAALAYRWIANEIAQADSDFPTPAWVQRVNDSLRAHAQKAVPR